MWNRIRLGIINRRRRLRITIVMPENGHPCCVQVRVWGRAPPPRGLRPASSAASPSQPRPRRLGLGARCTDGGRQCRSGRCSSAASFATTRVWASPEGRRACSARQPRAGRTAAAAPIPGHLLPAACVARRSPQFTAHSSRTESKHVGVSSALLSSGEGQERGAVACMMPSWEKASRVLGQPATGPCACSRISPWRVCVCVFEYPPPSSCLLACNASPLREGLG